MQQANINPHGDASLAMHHDSRGFESILERESDSNSALVPRESSIGAVAMDSPEKITERPAAMAIPVPSPIIFSIATPARVKVTDLIPNDGIPNDTYRLAVSTLSQSLARFNTAIIQLPQGDDSLLSYALDSSCVYFLNKRRPVPDLQPSLGFDDPQEWNRTAGYYADFRLGKETYDYRPGKLTSHLAEDSIPPSCLPETFSSLSKSSRIVLEAIGRSLDLRTGAFSDLLDNCPLKSGEVSASVLSATCYGRSMGTGMDVSMESVSPIGDDLEPKAEKGLLTLLKPDRPGLYVRDPQRRWILVDSDLSPPDVVLLTGLTLYQATAGYVSPTIFKTDVVSTAASQLVSQNPVLPGGRVSMMFKLLARASSIVHCAAMSASGHSVATPFQQPIAVQEFMQRNHPLDQILSTSYAIAGKMKKRKFKLEVNNRYVAPSKRLKIEAQRVLKEKVQDIAETKGLKVRFCNIKDCEEQHMHMEDPPCSFLRNQLAWPNLLPFVHPHDLPNKGKQMFIETYEPGWTERNQVEIPQYDMANTPKRHSPIMNVSASMSPLMNKEDKFSVKVIYDFLRMNNKAVPTGRPQVVGHKVDISLLCKLAYDSGGRESFEMQDGFQRFIAETFALHTASEKERERALERLRKLYDQVLQDYVEHLLSESSPIQGMEEVSGLQMENSTLQLEFKTPVAMDTHPIHQLQ